MHFFKAIGILACAGFCLFVGLPSSAVLDTEQLACSALIEIQTQPVREYLDFPGSSLKQVVRATVLCRTRVDGEFTAPCKYEEIWYQSRIPLGMKRYCQLPAPAHGSVAIRIASQSGALSEPEIASAASMLVRVLMDSVLNHNSVIRVEVPADSFVEFAAAMLNENFQVDAAGKGPAAFVIMLHSTDGRSALLSYVQTNH
jgi:hypothetical protein